MYRVTIDGVESYDPPNGVVLDSPKLTLEVNKAGSFETTIYDGHPMYGAIRKMRSVVEVRDRSGVIFRGRVVDDGKGFHGQRPIYCEGELAFLNDSVQRPYDYTGDVEGLFRQLITSHNSQVTPERQFRVGSVTVTDTNNYIHYSDSTYQNTWQALNEKLIKTHGGYLVVRHEADGNYLDYLADFTSLGEQPVEFGRNLLEFSQEDSGADFFTAVVPLGKRDEETKERLTVKGVNGGLDYVADPELVDEYGLITTTETWDDVTEAANLLRKGREYLATVNAFSRSIELSAVDLAALDAEITSFHVGTYVKVKSAPHGVDLTLLVSKMKIGLDSPASNSLTLGAVARTLTEGDGGIRDEINDAVGDALGDYVPPMPDLGPLIEDIQKAQDAADKAAEEAAKAAGIAGEKSTVLIQSERPAPVMQLPGTLWIDTTGGLNTPKRWDGQNWTAVTDKAALDAAQAAVDAERKAQDAQDAVDALTVGGRNLAEKTNQGALGWSWSMQTGGVTIEQQDAHGVLGVKFTRDDTEQTGWSVIQYLELHPEKFEPGTEYVVTFDAMPSVDSTYTVQFTKSDSTGAMAEVGVTTGTAKAGKWSRLHAILRTKDAMPDADGQVLYIINMASGPGVSHTFKNLKVEKGNRPTDWTPAPEDQRADVDSAVVQLTEQFKSDLERTEKGIMSDVSKSYYLKDDAAALVESISTRFEQTAESFDFRFETFERNAAEVQAGIDAEFSEIRKYIRFIDGNIVLGEEGNALTLKIENDVIAFYEGGVRVAYFANNKLYVTDGEFERLTLGNFAFLPRANGNLSFKKVVD